MSGVENMALDMTLLDRARSTGEYVFRVYSWARPTLSLGRNQTAAGRYRMGTATTPATTPATTSATPIPAPDIVRRPTGGRALLHHREITYSVTGPATESLRAIYNRINNVLLVGLKTMGIPAQLAAPKGRAPMPTDAPCFETPTAGELVVNGRKLAGSAQFREDGCFLQHGSILIDDDQGMIAGLMVTPAPPAVIPPITIREVLGYYPGIEAVSEALFGAVRLLEDVEASLLIDNLANGMARWKPHFESDEWTWRR